MASDHQEISKPNWKSIRKLGWQATPSATRILTSDRVAYFKIRLCTHILKSPLQGGRASFFFPSSILELEIAQELGLICFYCHICSAKLFDFSVRKAFHLYVTHLGEQPSVYVAEQNNEFRKWGDMKNLTESIKLHFCSESEHRYKKESVSSLHHCKCFGRLQIHISFRTLGESTFNFRFVGLMMLEIIPYSR